MERYQDNPQLIDNMIVYDDGIVKGVIGRTNIADSIEIGEFYVGPFFKGKGIGTKLIQYIISEAKKDNKKRIFYGLFRIIYRQEDFMKRMVLEKVVKPVSSKARLK